MGGWGICAFLGLAPPLLPRSSPDPDPRNIDQNMIDPEFWLHWPGGDILALWALPGLVSLPAAVEALHVDVPEGAVEDGQLVHVGGAQRNHLARQIRPIRKQTGMYAIHFSQMLSMLSFIFFPWKRRPYSNYHEFGTRRPKKHGNESTGTLTKCTKCPGKLINNLNLQALL